jgi:hypothetical protein
MVKLDFGGGEGCIEISILSSSFFRFCHFSEPNFFILKFYTIIEYNIVYVLIFFLEFLKL